MLIILEGHGRIESDSESADVPSRRNAGFFPPRWALSIRARLFATTLLRTYVPDLREFERELAGAHVDHELGPVIVRGASVSRGKAEAHIVILAGGRGTRFWPRSRMRTPKQLLNIVGTQDHARADHRTHRATDPGIAGFG